jgi:hypothetical protein
MPCLAEKHGLLVGQCRCCCCCSWLAIVRNAWMLFSKAATNTTSQSGISVRVCVCAVVRVRWCAYQ